MGFNLIEIKKAYFKLRISSKTKSVFPNIILPLITNWNKVLMCCRLQNNTSHF